jgi:hypothetical protein
MRYKQAWALFLFLASCTPRPPVDNYNDNSAEFFPFPLPYVTPSPDEDPDTVPLNRVEQPIVPPPVAKHAVITPPPTAVPKPVPRPPPANQNPGAVPPQQHKEQPSATEAAALLCQQYSVALQECSVALRHVTTEAEFSIAYRKCLDKAGFHDRPTVCQRSWVSPNDAAELIWKGQYDLKHKEIAEHK